MAGGVECPLVELEERLANWNYPVEDHLGWEEHRESWSNPGMTMSQQPRSLAL